MFIYIYIIAYILSFVLAKFSLYIASGVVLLGAALVIFISEYKRTGMLINLRGLFTLSFVGPGTYGHTQPAFSLLTNLH